MVRRIVKVLAVLAVVIVAAVFLLPSLQAQQTGFQTIIRVGLPDGSEKVIYSEGARWPEQAIVVLDGVTILYFRYITTFAAYSDDYTEYHIISPNELIVEIELFSVYEWIPCQPPLYNIDKLQVGDPTFNIAQSYNVAQDIMGLATDHTVQVNSADILAHLISYGCPTSGTYRIRYGIALSFEAIGITPVPSDTVANYYETIIAIVEGTITGSESTTVTTG